MSRPRGAGRHAARTYADIAAQIGVSKSTVHRDCRFALIKLGIDLETVPRQELRDVVKKLALV